MYEIITKLALGEKVNDSLLEEALFEMCDRVHSSCDSDCVVFAINGNKVPSSNPEDRFDCDCFKSGKKMLNFVREKQTK